MALLNLVRKTTTVVRIHAILPAAILHAIPRATQNVIHVMLSVLHARAALTVRYHNGVFGLKADCPSTNEYL